MQQSHLFVLGFIGLAIVGVTATDVTPAPTFNAPQTQGPAKPPAPKPRPQDQAASVQDPPMSNVDLRNEAFDRIREKAEAGGEVTDQEKRDFTDEVTRRLAEGGPQH